MDPRLSLARRAGVEALAVFGLVFAGYGGIVANAEYHAALGSLGISLAFGLIIMVMFYAAGHLSGVHINPAVTIAFTLTRHFSPRDAVACIAAQLTGAMLAALVLLDVWPSKPADLGATVPTVAVGSAFLYEAILIAFLMFVLMAVATDTRAVGAAAGIAIGGVIGLDALFGWTDFWGYLAGPIVGASLGAFAYQLVRPENPTHLAEPEDSSDGARSVRLPA